MFVAGESKKEIHRAQIELLPNYYRYGDFENLR